VLCELFNCNDFMKMYTLTQSLHLNIPTQGRRHGMNWGVHIHPTFARGFPEIDANPVIFYGEEGGGIGHAWS